MPTRPRGAHARRLADRARRADAAVPAVQSGAGACGAPGGAGGDRVPGVGRLRADGVVVDGVPAEPGERDVAEDAGADGGHEAKGGGGGTESEGGRAFRSEDLKPSPHTCNLGAVDV